MRLGKAYKQAALAAAHKVRAKLLLEAGDPTGAKHEELAYLRHLENIRSAERQRVAPFLDAVIKTKLDRTPHDGDKTV